MLQLHKKELCRCGLLREDTAMKKWRQVRSLKRKGLFMNAIQNILTRRSIRTFEDRPISKEDMKTILDAAMSGPTCANTRAWQFVVVEDKEMLNKMAQANGVSMPPR